jgi:hypothetical protein
MKLLSSIDLCHRAYYAIFIRCIISASQFVSAFKERKQRCGSVNKRQVLVHICFCHAKNKQWLCTRRVPKVIQWIARNGQFSHLQESNSPLLSQSVDDSDHVTILQTTGYSSGHIIIHWAANANNCSVKFLMRPQPNVLTRRRLDFHFRTHISEGFVRGWFERTV